MDVPNPRGHEELAEVIQREHISGGELAVELTKQASGSLQQLHNYNQLHSTGHTVQEGKEEEEERAEADEGRKQREREQERRDGKERWFKEGERRG